MPLYITTYINALSSTLNHLCRPSAQHGQRALLQFDMDKAVDYKVFDDGSVKFNIYMQLGIGETKQFLTGWQIDKPGDTPRIITGFRKDG